jgi:alkylation response protein AidB-like acyl-CoA dehydrogenase
MDFSVTAAQEKRIRDIRAFAQDVLSATPPGQGFRRELWDHAAAFGLAGLPVPIEWGGGGEDALDTALAVEALGRGCEDSGLVFCLCAHMFATVIPIWRAGSHELKERFLRLLARGAWIGANAASEPEAGSDVFAMQTRAVRRDTGYVLSGTKCHVTNAPVADLFLVYARTGDQAGPFGISGFLLPRNTPGLSVAPEPMKIGLTTAPWGTLQLTDCFVPTSHRLGEEGAGGAIFQDAMVWERICLFAAWVGAMERILARCIEHANQRRQFGRPLGAFQGVSHRLVDMKLRLETSRLLIYRAACLHREGKRCAEAAALAKLWVSESVVQSGLDAVQMFGAAGVTPSTGIDALLRDGLPLRIASGASEVMRDLIARHMGIN